MSRSVVTHGSALISKLDGLDDATARSTPTANSLSLPAVVKHSAIWERRWFQVMMAGRKFPGEWPEVEDDEQTGLMVDENDTVDHWIAYYREQITESRAVSASMDLDAPCRWPMLIECNVRWVLGHMIEEVARHAGPADIIRETIAGSRGLRGAARSSSGSLALRRRRRRPGSASASASAARLSRGRS